MVNKSALLENLKKARKHLQYSYDKVIKIDLEVGELDEEALETLESFSSRFARFSDLLIAKYFRTLALEKDPAFRGSIVDLLNFAEKFAWIESAPTWKRIRALRNLAAHEYEASDYIRLYAELVALAPWLFKVSLDL